MARVLPFVQDAGGKEFVDEPSNWWGLVLI
jgi:hypothetical protein